MSESLGSRSSTRSPGSTGSGGSGSGSGMTSMAAPLMGDGTKPGDTPGLAMSSITMVKPAA